MQKPPLTQENVRGGCRKDLLDKNMWNGTGGGPNDGGHYRKVKNPSGRGPMGQPQPYSRRAGK